MSATPPNVICILADDLGWRDVGCYGSQFYETPAIDGLARDGTRFTDAYASSPVCSPTRASIMTGNYPARVGVTNYIDTSGSVHPSRGKLIDAEYTDHLPESQTSLATALSDAGYRTWHVGKWHLGGEEQGSLPTDRGFDRNIGGSEWGSPLGASDGYYSPEEIPNLDPDSDGAYLPEVLIDRAVDLIGEHDQESPFFLHYAPYLVHTPIQAPDDLVATYRHKRDSLGLDRMEEFKLGAHHPTERKKDERIKRRLVQSDPTYAAMVQTLDENVGRLLDALDRSGQADNTIVIFSSDNGGLATAEGSPTTNRPLAEGKGWMQEGGNRVPLIVRWPAVTGEDTAPDIVSTPVTSPDVYSTVLDAAGIPVPDGAGIDGESIRPLVSKPDASLDRDAIFWHYPHYGNQGGTPAAAIRTGDWKLIEFFEDDTVRLYHLRTDIGEERDLSDIHPEKAATLRERLQEWQDHVGARYPTENSQFNPWPDRASPN